MARLKNFHPKIQEVLNKFIDSIRDRNQAIEARELSVKLFCEITANTIYCTSSENIQQLSSRMEIKISTLTLVKMLLISAFPSLKNRLKIQFSKPEDHLSFLNLIKKSLEDRQQCQEKHEDFLDYLLNLKNVKKDVDDVNLAAHALPYLSHGVEMSSIALSHTLYEVKN